MEMITVSGYSTTSYGHVLARQIRRAVEQIPEFRRERIAGLIEDRSDACRMFDIPANDDARRYAVALLRGKKPEPLGHNRIRRDR